MGASRDGWIITEVKCSYFYWGNDGNERVPKDRDFEQGEFEKLYGSLPTFEYIFNNGMNPLDPFFMNQVVEEIRKQKPEFDLEIDSITTRGIKPTIKFVVSYEHKEEAKVKVKDTFEERATDENWVLKEVISALKNQSQALKNLSMHRPTMNDNRQIIIENLRGDVKQIGMDNYGTQTWNEFNKQMRDSSRLDDGVKNWLQSITLKLQEEAIPNDEQPVVQSKMSQLKTEMEKENPDENIIKRAWNFLVTAAPTIKTLAEIPPQIAKLIELSS